MLDKKKSKIHGFGMFTDEKIRKGRAFYKIYSNYVYNYAKPHCAYIGNNKWVSDDRVLNWVNHSCDPNSKLDTKKLTLVALRNIDLGEEVTVDYEKTEKKVNKIKCNCKSENCRGEFFRGE